MREQQLAKQRVAVSRNDYILTFGEVFETSLTFWDSMNSFSVRFAILHTLCHTYCCTWPTVTKALPMPTNSNAHVSPVGSKVMRCVRGIQYKSNKSLRSVLELRSFYGANRSVPRPFCYRLTPILETVGHSVPKLFCFFLHVVCIVSCCFFPRCISRWCSARTRSNVSSSFMPRVTKRLRF